MTYGCLNYVIWCTTIGKYVQAVTVSRMGTSIELYCIAAEVAIAVSVDARTGKYVVDANQLREVSGVCIYMRVFLWVCMHVGNTVGGVLYNNIYTYLSISNFI